MSLNGNTDEINGYNSVMKEGSVAYAKHVKAVIPPIGSIISWCKTFASADSGTTDSTTANKLVESGQNFETTVKVGMIVYNTTDATWAYVTAVDSDTTLSLSADIMITGENYTIYSTPTLPDGWVECDGSVLSDSDSPFNGATIPDLNGDGRFLKGSSTSGTETAATSHNHHWCTGYKFAMASGSGANAFFTNSTYDSDGNAIAVSTGNTPYYNSKVTAPDPINYTVVFIMRVK